LTSGKGLVNRKPRVSVMESAVIASSG